MPYVATVELDIARYIGKNVNVKYYFDTRTGACLACLFANGVLTDYYNGQMGVTMPITLTDYSAYANAQIQTLLGGGNSLKRGAQTIGQSGMSMVESGVGIGATAVGLAPVGAVVAGASATKTLYGMTQNNINNFNKTTGGSSSMLNEYLPQEVCFIFEIQDADETPLHNTLLGHPTNASGALSNFAGYLEVDAVNLQCGIATENERNEIISMLKSGVII